MVRKLRLKSGEEAPVERITKKTKHKMIKVKIKMRRNSEVRRVKTEESETRSCVNEKIVKIQNKREMRWW